MSNVYNILLENLKKVNKEAKQMIETLNYKNIANCKVLSQRLVNHNIEGIEK